MPTVRIQEKNYSESIMVLKLKDGYAKAGFRDCNIQRPPFSYQKEQWESKQLRAVLLQDF